MVPCYYVRRAFAVLVSFAVVASAATAAAQYMYLDANGDGVHTSADFIPSQGTAALDVWLVTDHNRDGSPAVCAQDPSALLTINSYTFLLRATQGSVIWSDFQNHVPEFTLDAGRDSSLTEYWVGRASGTILPPGKYRLASVNVTPASGTPAIWIVSAPETITPIAMTSFGCQCLGTDFDNTMKLGSDWHDADGVPIGVEGNHLPLLDTLSPMTVSEGTTAEQVLHATDADGEPLTFTADGAPAWVTVTTTDPGTGTAAGLVRAAPGFFDAGSVTPVILVSDGISQNGTLLRITVTDVNQPPVWRPLADMTVEEGTFGAQDIGLTDPDGGLQWDITVVSGPSFVHLGQIARGWGIASAELTVAPLYSDAGIHVIVLEGSDGMAAVRDSIQVTVTEGNQPPIMAEDLGTITVSPGTLRTVDVPATDPEGELLTFSKEFGPGYMTVLTVDPGPGSGLGRVELRPVIGDLGGFGTVKVSDGVKSSRAGLSIEVPELGGVNTPPIVDPIADMVIAEGSQSSQVVSASDPDGSPLAFNPVNFPQFMSLDPIAAGPPTGSARISAAPRAGDRGRYPVAVSVSDGLSGTQASFFVTVPEPGAGSTMLMLRRDPAPVDDWGILQFREGEGAFSPWGAPPSVGIHFEPPEPPPVASVYGPTIKLACLPAQRPACISDRINNWTLSFHPPTGRLFTTGVYSALPNPDSTHAGFVASNYCSFRSNTSFTLEIKQIEYGSNGSMQSFWATARHDPDATGGLFAVEVRYHARLPVSIDAPSRVEAHAGDPLEVSLRIGGYAPGPSSVSSPDLPDGASLTLISDSAAVFRWTPRWEDKGLYQLRLVAARPGVAADTSLMTTCVEIPGEVTATLDANRLEAIVTNRGITRDVVNDAPGLVYPRGSGFAVSQSVGLLLGGLVDGVPRIAMPGSCCDYHPGPIQNGAAVPFEPRFKNYKIRSHATADFDWLHWPSDLGAPVDFDGSPLLTGDQTIWSLYNDAPAPWEAAPYSSRPALGVEVRQTTWGRASMAADGDAVYQSFQIRNSGSHEIHALYAAIHVDPTTIERLEVLHTARGLMACDTTLGLGYAYGGRYSYYPHLNAVGVLMLHPPRPAAIQDVRWSDSENQVYAQLQGLNPDGLPRHERDNSALPVTTFAYSGDPLLGTGWLYPDYPYSTVQLFVSAGPFDLMPGQTQEVTVALLGAAAYFPLDAVAALKARAEALRTTPAPGPNGSPIAEAGGPYSGFAGVPIQFDGSRSSDPEGDPLTYTWRFGDEALGNGVQPLHTYAVPGSYKIRLSVFDQHTGQEDTTSVQVAPIDSAGALLMASGPAVRLQSIRPLISIALEPVNGAFAVSEVDLASVTLERADGIRPPIRAVQEKHPASGDADHDGFADVAVSFQTSDMRSLLFDLPPGESEVLLWVRGTLGGGGRFAAPLRLVVDAGKKGLSVSVAPNPLNPSATLTFRTHRKGAIRVLLFDVHGRLIRVALDAPSVDPGYHDIAVGRDASGHDLPSGVYFYRVVTPEGSASGKLVMMK